MDDETKERIIIFVKWLAVIIIIVMLGKLAEWVLVAYPLPHYVQASTVDLANLSFKK